MVDFGKRLAKGGKSKLVDPLALYETLDRASDKGPLRPAQEAILKEWHATHRSDPNLIVKLHTGQGKTLIGLLMLQSHLNERGQPAVYLCPDRFLVNQTRSQASQFGISHCIDEGSLPPEFLDGKSILITTVQKLFNGRTQFGLDGRSQPVGALVLDDSHACVESIRDACVIRVARDDKEYQQLLGIFEEPLKHQGLGTLLDIRGGEGAAILPVPYWAWQLSFAEVAKCLSELTERKLSNGDRHSGWFVWPLLKDMLHQCRCIVSGTAIEISPYLPPLEKFGSYAKASHRIFMSATVTNDAFLVKGLQLSPTAIQAPLTYANEKWSGEKMILFPSLIDDSLERMTIVQEFAKPRVKNFGCVALTPSFRVAENWKTCGATVATRETIDHEVARLRKGDVGHTLAVASRYDGVDLPDAACRLLILDSVPRGTTLTEEYEERCRAMSKVMLMKQARSIEQGLGRAVRGEKDFCAMLIIGADLVRLMRSAATSAYFSAQTRMQVGIGLEATGFAEQDRKDGQAAMTVLIEMINQCLKRDENWKQFYSEQMDTIVPDAITGEILEVFAKELRAERAFQFGDAAGACKAIQELLDGGKFEDVDKGWYVQEMARYRHAMDSTASNKLQVEAHKMNHALMRPRTGMVTETIEYTSSKRGERVVEWIRNHGSAAELMLSIDDIASALSFGVSHDRFEEAILKFGRAIGFTSQRPEQVHKEGPDNLWAVGDGVYFVIECKSEVDTERAEISKTETGQMSNAQAWFARTYPGATGTAIMVIPPRRVAKSAGFGEGVLLLRKAGLARLVARFRAFFHECAAMDIKDLSEAKILAALSTNRLNGDQIMDQLETPIIPGGSTSMEG